MFHTIIYTAYIIPNIYIFFRIGKVFINKGYRIYYVLIYLLVVSIYPLANYLSHSKTGSIIDIMELTGNYLLPFYLYLFLFVLAFDIFLLINLKMKIVPYETMKNTRFKITVLSIILFLSLSVVIGGIINFNTIRTSEYHIEIPGKYSKIDHIKIAFVADFHLKESTNIHFVERYVKKINTIQPDLMLYGGDFVEGDREDKNMIGFEKLFRGIKPKYGSFTVLGNHEHYSGQDKSSFFLRSGIKVLCDSFVIIDNSINLGGRNDSHYLNRKSINELIQSSVDYLPVILIDHRPTDLDNVSRTRVDVQFSGHTHGGQMFPINLITNNVYELSWGYKKKGNTHFFVTSGIRLWGPPVRTSGKAEIMVVEVNFKGK